MKYRIKIVNNYDGKGDLYYPQFKKGIFSSWKTIRKSSGELDMTIVFPTEVYFKYLEDAKQCIWSHQQEEEKSKPKQVVRYIYNVLQNTKVVKKLIKKIVV